MARCSYHRPVPVGQGTVDLRCAAEAVPYFQRCDAHGDVAFFGPPFDEALATVTTRSRGGCLVWLPLAEWAGRQRGRAAAELFAPGTARPTFWHDEFGLHVDLGGWLHLERYGRPRQAGSVQRCGTPGCVEPGHSEAPVRRAGRRRVDVVGRLDRRFGWGAA